MSQIAHAAGGLYGYSSSREALIEAALSRVLDEDSKVLASAYEPASP